MAEYLRAQLSKAQNDLSVDDIKEVRRLQGECRAYKRLINDLVSDAKTEPR